MITTTSSQRDEVYKSFHQFSLLNGFFTLLSWGLGQDFFLQTHEYLTLFLYCSKKSIWKFCGCSCLCFCSAMILNSSWYCCCFCLCWSISIRCCADLFSCSFFLSSISSFRISLSFLNFSFRICTASVVLFRLFGPVTSLQLVWAFLFWCAPGAPWLLIYFLLQKPYHFHSF